MVGEPGEVLQGVVAFIVRDGSKLEEVPFPRRRWNTGRLVTAKGNSDNAGGTSTSTNPLG